MRLPLEACPGQGSLEFVRRAHLQQRPSRLTTAAEARSSEAGPAVQGHSLTLASRHWSDSAPRLRSGPSRPC